MADSSHHVRLVAFDLDGTLLHGDTVCEAIARRLGQLKRMQELEHRTQEQTDRIGRTKRAEQKGPNKRSNKTAEQTRTPPNV